MEFLENYFGSILNAIFTLLMLSLAWVDYKSFNTPRHRDFKSIIMSTGVLGTFVGIFVGLFGFNTLNIQDSIPLLLEGLKVAFYTSIVGMGISIALSILQKGKVNQQDSADQFSLQLQKFDDLTYLQDLKELKILPQILDALNTQKHNIEALNEGRKEHYLALEEMTKTHSSTLIECLNHQHQLLSTQLQNEFATLSQTLKKSVEELAKGASEHLVETLAEVIKNFNTNLNNQFGENFKELNIAVGRMLTWQEHYQQSIETSQETLKQAVIAIEKSGDTLSRITEHHHQTQTFFNQLGEMIQQTRQEGEVLFHSLESFAGLKKNAEDMLESCKQSFEISVNTSREIEAILKNAFNESEETLKQRILRIGEQSSDIITNLQSHFHAFSEHFNSEVIGIYRHLNQQIQEDSALFIENMNTQSGEFKQGIAALQTTGEESFLHLRENLENLSKNSAKQLQESIAHSEELLKNRSEALEQLISNHTKSVKENFQEIGGEFSNVIQNIGNGVNHLQENLQQELTHTMQNLRSDLKNFNSHLNTELMQTTQSFKEKLSQDSSILLEHLRKEGKERELLFTAQQQFIEEQQRIAKEGIIAGANAMVKQNRAFLESVGTQTKEFFTRSLNEWKQEQKNAIDTGLEDYRRLSLGFNDLLQNLLGHLNMLQHGISQGVAEVRESLKKAFSDMIMEMKKSSDEYNHSSLAIMESNISSISNKITTLQELSHQSMERITADYIASLKGAMQESANIPKEVSVQILSEVQNLQKAIAANILTTNQDILHNKEEVSAMIAQVNSSLQNELNSASQINKNLQESLQKLDESLSHLTDGFKGDYEWFLRRISDFMGNRN
ncbi:hypothetical protein CCZ01_03295 [Helicobacter monodelphidis]|uniref:hypothetical protein n=1 Tax=Helicobacter sp. 15-1451 TaxID=2004995 RepID=UPI000DCD2584|nr:hypothetical protein [Helicobacter sp. 15-1451]RAX58118.1 hypothetical protein CCZ01_03295 [Helicobacter sp. 15-1451]